MEKNLLDLVYIYPGGVRTGSHLFFFGKRVFLKHPSGHTCLCLKLIGMIHTGKNTNTNTGLSPRLDIIFENLRRRGKVDTCVCLVMIHMGKNTNTNTNTTDGGTSLT